MRLAFSMIELIFAIVIIGISVLTIPTMTEVNNTSISENLKQEAVFAASAKMMQVLSYNWDEHSRQAGIDNEKIVDIPGGTAIYARINADNNRTIRVGNIDEDNHRSFFEYNVTNSLISVFGVDDDNTTLAMDELAAANVAFINNGASDSGYKDSYSTSVAVGFQSDTSTNLGQALSPNNSNLKVLRVSVASNRDPNNPVVLYAYSANIGTFTIFRGEIH